MRAEVDQRSERLYDRMIEESAPLEGVSGLGLARIRAEGGLDFDYTIEGDELTLIVTAPVPEPPSFGAPELAPLDAPRTAGKF